MTAIGKLRQTALNCLRAAFCWFVRSSPDKGHLEVERKFIISAQEAVELSERLRTFGFEFSKQVSMSDTFLPTSVAGEMMRVRNERSSGASACLVTFKQWVSTPDGGKERQETEREIGWISRSLLLFAGKLVNQGELLSFSKKRDLYLGNLAGRQAVVSIDQVEGLGKYSGFYLEVEVLVPLHEDVTKAKEQIFDLVAQLFAKARQDVKQSYMDMLIKSKQ